MKNQYKLVVLAAVAAATALAAFRLVSRPETALKASGTVEARNIRVGSKAGGRVARVLVKEGDRVKTGQTLVTFDGAELNASLAPGGRSRGAGSRIAR